MWRQFALLLSLFSLSLASLVYASDDCTSAARGEYIGLLKCCAERGDAIRQYELGNFYQHGTDVPQDYFEALRWYRMAADQGFSPAQLEVGNMYAKGIGVPQNDAEAAEWYRKAAEHGNVFAQTELGSRYFVGLGVPKDYVQAHMWFNLAAAHSDEGNFGFPSTAKECRDQVEKKMT